MEELKLAVPESLEIPTDKLLVRLDFHSNIVLMHEFEDEKMTTKVVSAIDIAHALTRELAVSTGILPKDALWWMSTRNGAVTALWRPPKVWRVALQRAAMGTPQRFTLPMPGLIFLCQPGQAPWVFAAKRRPTKPADLVYKAPLANIFQDGRSCPGNHKFPLDVGKIPDSFFRSFFSPTADLRDRSRKFPGTVVDLWKHLDGKDKYPMGDLVQHGTVGDLIQGARRW